MFALFCLGNSGSNLGPEKIPLIAEFLLYQGCLYPGYTVICNIYINIYDIYIHIYIYIYIYIKSSVIYIYIYIYIRSGVAYICIKLGASVINIYIYIYMYIYTKTSAKEAVLLPVKSSSDDDPGFRLGFKTEASSPLTQGAPAVSHNTTRLYWMVFNLYECHIRSDAVTALFWIFFYLYSLFFAGVSPILFKNVEVAFEIKPRHPISRGNMSVDQSFLVHCSRKSSYFSNFCWIYIYIYIYIYI